MSSGMRYQIGVLGCSGTVGSSLAEKLLRQGYSVLGGRRTDAALFDEYDNFTFRRTDTADEQELISFCRDCEVIVNCVSPVYRHSERIAAAAASQGCKYVDSTDYLSHCSSLPENGVYILNGGYVPGLAEFLVLEICRTEFDTVSRAVMYQGGTEVCSESALVDIIMSAGSSGHADAFFRNGIKPLHIGMKKRYRLPDLRKEVMMLT